MYCSIYADRTYGDNWSLLIHIFTATGGGLVGGLATFIDVVNMSMKGGGLGGGLTPIIIFDLDIVGESRPAGSLCTESHTPLKMDKCN